MGKIRPSVCPASKMKRGLESKKFNNEWLSNYYDFGFRFKYKGRWPPAFILELQKYVLSG
jgi:hypothetical protein